MAIASWSEYDQWSQLLQPGDPRTALLDLLTPPRWHQDAACRGHDPGLWFPAAGDQALEAKAVCYACPVAHHCRAAALDDASTVGVWAATTAADRRRLRARGD